MANLRARSGAQVWGVCYRIESDDAARLDRSEGVPRAYQREAVTVRRRDERDMQLELFEGS